jgi:alkanesulfonate monooxygenase SsuD/methylene tetrahydromethanopterin reductase-like flavin-dependent oxidoreductase (luciferase family)
VAVNPFFISAATPVAGADAIDPALLKRVAVMADRGGLDFLVLRQPGDAVIAASWLIPVTRRIGLISTLAATYSQPFHVARGLSAMDILSGGRMGWLPQAAHHQEQAPYFGNLPSLPLPDALDKATELVSATEALWDSWDEDALIIDKGSARYLDNAKIRRVDYRGAHFQVMGALNSARPPQGYPILVLDDADPLFERLHEQADVLLITAASIADAEKRIRPLVGPRAQRILVKIACDGPAADIIEEFRHSGVCDGCHLLPGPPNMTETVLTELLSDLRRRGMLTESSAVGTLRARLGLPFPVNPYFAAGAA